MCSVYVFDLSGRCFCNKNGNVVCDHLLTIRIDDPLHLNLKAFELKIDATTIVTNQARPNRSQNSSNILFCDLLLLFSSLYDIHVAMSSFNPFTVAILFKLHYGEIHFKPPNLNV